MQVMRIENGMFDSNVYLIIHGKECILVDAGVSAVRVGKTLTANDWTLKAIILTHGHVDHVCQLEQFKQMYAVPIMMHIDEAALFTNDDANGYNAFGIPKSQTMPVPDRLLVDGELIAIGDSTVQVIHTPGHTAGSICLYAADFLITGDTLFKTSIGRTDLHTGDHTAILSSIRNRLFVLPPNTIVYPGHGPESSIDFERKYNPHVR